jgi:hypothetical protein
VIGAVVPALAQGRGGVLVIEGPPGLGKSRLLTVVMALADKGGVRTLFGEAFEYQQTVPLFALFMATMRADPVISRPGSWRMSPSLASTVATGTRAGPYATWRRFACSPARVMRPKLMTWPRTTTRTSWR